MRKTHLLALSVLLAASQIAFAGPIVELLVNTSSIAGTTGSIDFQFNPGPGTTQAAMVQVLDFTSTGTYIAASQLDIGAVTGGPVPSTLAISNTDADNEDFEDFTFGNSILFELSLSGPAVTAPNGTATSPTTFYFSTFSNAAGTIPVLTSNPLGIDAEVTVNTNGSLSTSTTTSDASFVPEPSSAWMVSGALLALGIVALSNRCGQRRGGAKAE
jgi:hypothetical protein